MNGYDLSRIWFDFAFEKTECKVQHTALYLWIVELNNRLGWKKEFGLPTNATMEGLGIGNRGTYSKTLFDLKDWGFIEIVQESKNQYQACIIKLCLFNSEQTEHQALDQALIRQSVKQSTGIEQSTASSTVPIDKQRNKETKKPINNKTNIDADRVDVEKVRPVGEERKEVPPKVAPKGSFNACDIDLPFDSKEFKEAWDMWVAARKEKKKPVSEAASKLSIDLLRKHDVIIATQMVLNSVKNDWQGIFDLKSSDLQKLSHVPQKGNAEKNHESLMSAFEELVHERGLTPILP